MTDDPDLVGVADIAVMLGVSRQRVFQLYQRPDFPAPFMRRTAGMFWRSAEVRAWAEATGREWRARPRPKPRRNDDDAS